MLELELVNANDSNFPKYWSQLLLSDGLQNTLYSEDSLAVSADTFARLTPISPAFNSGQPAEDEGKNFSFVLLENDSPVLGCSLSLHENEEGLVKLGYKGLGATTHINPNALGPSSHNLSAQSFAVLQSHMNQLLQELQPDIVEFWDGVNCGVMSPVTQCLVARGGSAEFGSSWQLDTRSTSRELLRNVSKPTRSYIQWGQRNLQLSVRNDNLALYDYLTEFTSNHQDKESCLSAALWSSDSSLKSLLSNGNVFLVNGYLDRRLVATVVFSHFGQFCQYLGSARFNTGTEQPVLHSLIWQAVLHARSLGCTQVELDHRFNLQSSELIDFSGFGGLDQTRIKVVLTNESSPEI